MSDILLFDILKILEIFYLERENKAIKNKILEDLRTLYETNEGNYYEPIKTKGAFNDSLHLHLKGFINDLHVYIYVFKFKATKVRNVYIKGKL